MNNYRTKSTDELRFIIKDASEAATCAKDLGDTQAECKYLDQVNDACSELYKRRKQNYAQQMNTFAKVRLDRYEQQRQEQTFGST